MVITMDIPNLANKGKIYYFRLRVPKDLVETVGKKEIVESLKTEELEIAAIKVKRRKQFWDARFQEYRAKESPPAPKEIKTISANIQAAEFREILIAHTNNTLPEILALETEAELLERFKYYGEAIEFIRKNNHMGLDLDELGFSWPFPPFETPQHERRCREVAIEILKTAQTMIVKEMVNPPSSTASTAHAPAREHTPSDLPEEVRITDIVELIIDAKRTPEKAAFSLRADVEVLKKWCQNKEDVTTYTKRDLIDFTQNCLPHIPSNMHKKKVLANKSLQECVELTKKNPDIYPPISHRTCKNRHANISMIFNYAKEYLGVISINPAKNIEIPEVRVIDSRPKGLTPDELISLWTALQPIKDITESPSFYWTTVLSLYHGYRLNEVCSLFIKDVYQDEDGIYVIDINDDGPFKSVKNKSSVRIVPIHPFVLNQLGFEEYIETQKAREEGLLFPNVSASSKNGYLRKTSYWFNNWKKEWLQKPVQYKNFHDLRYTFIQQAQNVAQIPDRHAQEITGHSIEGVSAVHLGYSGRLKSKALLEELQKIRYGWE